MGGPAVRSSLRYNCADIICPAKAASHHLNALRLMWLLDLTLDSPAENLALDEALLDEAEAATEPMETLRLWEPHSPMVVVGRSSRILQEVRWEVCTGRGIPVLRRASGGAAVLLGPGCLVYSLVLSLQRRPALRIVEQAHRAVLERLANALRQWVPGIRRQGISDLALGEAKFSGNSLRLKRRCLLYHGTLLYNFPLELVETCLAMPPRQPAYRQGRPHRTFLTNLPLCGEAIRRAVAVAWSAKERRTDWPQALTTRLAMSKPCTTAEDR